jgi:hypothetical protein
MYLVVKCIIVKILKSKNFEREMMVYGYKFRPVGLGIAKQREKVRNNKPIPYI